MLDATISTVTVIATARGAFKTDSAGRTYSTFNCIRSLTSPLTSLASIFCRYNLEFYYLTLGFRFSFR